MGDSYTSLYVHCVFSTRERRQLIPAEVQPRLWGYVGGIARTNGMKALAVGGTDDHAHVLLALPPTMPVSKAVQLVKGGSSKWLHDTIPVMKEFAWQAGYGAFSIGVSQVDTTVAYINRQAEHHRTKTFEEEYLAFLEKHGIEYDERYIWG